jgi:hypothetical protein
MMDGLMSILAVLLGLLVRFGIPILATLLIVLWLRQLDEKWKEQAVTGIGLRARNPGCWKINNCPPERRSKCPAYANPETPCWQVFRAEDGQLLDTCIGCEIFRGAPVPV